MLLEQIIEQLPENVTLFVFVDHGRTDFKHHGGPSDGETHTIFSMYQKDAKFRYGLDKKLINGKLPIIQQVDISGVLSDLLQIPRPYNSISRVLPEFLAYSDDVTDFEAYVDILKMVLLNEIQVASYLEEYLTFDPYMTRDVKNAMKSFIAQYKNKQKVFSILKNIKQFTTENSNLSQDQIIADIDNYIKDSQSNFEGLGKVLAEYLPHPRFEISNGTNLTIFKLLLLLLEFISVLFFLITLAINKLGDDSNWWSYGVLDESGRDSNASTPTNRKVSIQLIILAIEGLFIIFFRYNLMILFFCVIINLVLITPYFIKFVAKMDINQIKSKIKKQGIVVNMMNLLTGFYLLTLSYRDSDLYYYNYLICLFIFVLYFINAIRIKSFIGMAFLLG